MWHEDRYGFEEVSTVSELDGEGQRRCGQFHKVPSQLIFVLFLLVTYIFFSIALIIVRNIPVDLIAICHSTLRTLARGVAGHKKIFSMKDMNASF